MKALALSLLFVLCAVSCWAQPTEPAGEVIEETEVETGVVLEEIHLQGNVDGTRFSWDSPLPVVPGRKAKGQTTFTIGVSFLGAEVHKVVLKEFETLEFKPGGGGGGGGGLGRWGREANPYQVWVDDQVVSEIEFNSGEPDKRVKLTQEGHGSNGRQMLGFTVALLNAEGEIIAEFVDPWDIQP